MYGFQPGRFETYPSRKRARAIFPVDPPPQQLAPALYSTPGMANLYLVKTNRPKQTAKRRGRGSAVSTERRYRYPSEEIWQVSETRWQAAETRCLRHQHERPTR